MDIELYDRMIITQCGNCGLKYGLPESYVRMKNSLECRCPNGCTVRINADLDGEEKDLDNARSKNFRLDSENQQLKARIIELETVLNQSGIVPNHAIKENQSKFMKLFGE